MNVCMYTPQGFLGTVIPSAVGWFDDYNHATSLLYRMINVQILIYSYVREKLEFLVSRFTIIIPGSVSYTYSYTSTD